MKKVFILGLVLIFIGIVWQQKDVIISFVDEYIISRYTPVTLDSKNEYYRDYDFLYVQNTNNFKPSNMQDIINIYYTTINAGLDEFTFYCPSSYKECLEDVRSIANNQEDLSNINNYVHPFNGFSHIETEYDTLGRVTVKIEKSYNNKEIDLINNKIDSLVIQLTSNYTNIRDKIKNIHDYIINNSKYDSIRSEDGFSKYKSDIAYGPLFEGYAVCGGYTDLMELFLERLNIKSYKISSNNHIWNAVEMDGVWYHLDLTWDDPVASDGLDYLEYNYFLISTNKLLSLDTTQHQFDQNVFKELKEA